MQCETSLLIKQKVALRQEMRERRRKLNGDFRTIAHRSAAELIRNSPRIPTGSEVGLYWPLPEEFDTRPLIDVFRLKEATVCLPVVVDQNTALKFRMWNRGDPLRHGPLGTLEPSPTASYVDPKMLIVPMVAFDEFGYRLGYGGGYYDRTLCELRSRVDGFLAIGLAYEDQKVSLLPREQFDEPIDGILTEKRLSNSL